MQERWGASWISGQEEDDNEQFATFYSSLWKYDCFEIKKVLTKMLGDLRSKGVHTESLFLNTDIGFDSKELRELLESKGIHANIKEKKRKGQWTLELSV